MVDIDLFDKPLILWTKRRVTQAKHALAVYADWQRRPSIEHRHHFIFMLVGEFFHNDLTLLVHCSSGFLFTSQFER